ncbi:hypothetical protein OS965_41305, partial [Streptomyces sp. H27-G5]|uniref:hypothetical protein n=1 Tax=Streptomyces sp. H27-G5 TaxID=2996698 RepID=UPI002271D891
TSWSTDSDQNPGDPGDIVFTATQTVNGLTSTTQATLTVTVPEQGPSLTLTSPGIKFPKWQPFSVSGTSTYGEAYVSLWYYASWGWGDITSEPGRFNGENWTAKGSGQDVGSYKLKAIQDGNESNEIDLEFE